MMYTPMPSRGIGRNKISLLMMVVSFLRNTPLFWAQLMDGNILLLKYIPNSTTKTFSHVNYLSWINCKFPVETNSKVMLLYY